MSQPLVSICCITYNHVDFIKDAIEGFLSQKTTFTYEICIGEDESNDGTREIIKEYAAKYPNKIRLFLRKRKDVIYFNGKATGRFNFMETLKKARGKYIATCEGDDYWLDPLKLQKQVDFMEKNNQHSFCGGRTMIGTRMKLFPHPSWLKGNEEITLERYLQFHLKFVKPPQYYLGIIQK